MNRVRLIKYKTLIVIVDAKNVLGKRQTVFVLLRRFECFAYFDGNRCLFVIRFDFFQMMHAILCFDFFFTRSLYFQFDDGYFFPSLLIKKKCFKRIDTLRYFHTIANVVDRSKMDFFFAARFWFASHVLTDKRLLLFF